MTTVGESDYNWKGLCFDLSKFCYKAFLDNRDDMANSNVVTVKEALHLLENYSMSETLFTRPSKDLKQYSGIVGTKEYIHEMLTDMVEVGKDQSIGSYGISEDELIVLDTVKNIQSEYRWFIVGKKIVSGSIYRQHGQLILENVDHLTDIVEEAQTFADKWLPHDNCVMDLTLIDEQLKVLEFNCINSSGFYKNDVDKIFKALKEYYESA